jgi:hypothetical protein
MSRRFVRIAAALTLTAALAVPAAQAAGPFHPAVPRPGLLELAWSWLAGLSPDTALADKGFSIAPDGGTTNGDIGYGIDPNGGTTNGDIGYGIDPDGSTVQGAEPRTTSNQGDIGFGIDPNG